MARRKKNLHTRPWQRGDTALGYLRVSKVGDRGDDLISDDVQKDVIRRWADREGVTIIDWVTDLDKSGREDNKRQIGKSIDRVRGGEAKGIAVWKVSRWGRNLVDSMLNIAELQEAGGWIASGTESLDEIETPMGKFSLTQMLAIAQLQSDQIGETWVNIHDYRRGMGLPHTGGPRFGYAFDGEVKATAEPAKVYTIDPLTGPWLARAYKEFVAGVPLNQICQTLDANGIRTVKGRKWIYTSLLGQLDSGFGAGLIVDKRDAVNGSRNPSGWEFTEGAHRPVIDRATWDAYLRRRSDVRPARAKSPAHRLSGLVVCSGCMSKMVHARSAQNGHGQQYASFKCNLLTAKYGSTQTCPGSSAIKTDRLVDHVYDWLLANLKGEEKHATLLAREEQATLAQADSEAVEADIRRLSRRLSQAMDLLLDEEDPSMVLSLREKQKEIRAELADLKVERDRLENVVQVSTLPARDAFGALVALWGRPDEAMLNAALRKIIGRIEVSKGTRWTPVEDRVRIYGAWEVGQARPLRSRESKAQPVSA